MATVYTLTAVNTPVPVVPGAIHKITDVTPLVAQVVVANETVNLRTKLNEDIVRGELSGRSGGGGYAISENQAGILALSDGGALVLNIAAGEAMLDGAVQLNAATTAALTDNINAPGIFVYISAAGAIVQVNNSLTPPGGAHAYLGRVKTSGGSITEIDGSGVMYLRGGTLVRRTNDVSVPTDTPPATLQFVNYGPTKTWFWDGIRYSEWGSPSGSGLFTNPLVITSGASETIEAGRQAVLAQLQVDGTLTVNGLLRIIGGP
tara:strand:- start:1681 stop:2466 length:786 start_codon:yes stop_codon:yes gene_type:complete